MLDAIAKKALSERLTSNPAERDRFIANPGGYLEAMGVYVPEGSGRKNMARAGEGPLPVAL